MTLPADTVDLDDEFVVTLIDFCRGRILLKLGGKPFASASLSYSRFIHNVKDMVISAGMIFPRYFVAEAEEGVEGKGK